MASILEIILRSIKQGTGFQQTEKDVSQLSKASAGLNKMLASAGLAISAQQLIAYGQAAVSAAREAAAAEAGLQSVLESTGNAAGVTKDQLIAMATALENSTNFSDEAVMKGQELLLTFTKIGSEVFPQATQAIADMSVRFGQDLSSSAIQLGKALNDPIAGISALTRIGVQFTDQQKAQVAAMMEVGNIAGAQAIILAEITTQTAGAAQAARDAAGGAQDWIVANDRLQESFGNLLLAIGDSGVGGAAVGLIETLDRGAQTWTSNVEQIQLFMDAMNNANQAISGNSKAVADNANELGFLQKIQKGWELALTKGANLLIESTVGYDQLAESYGVVQQEALAAEEAIRVSNDALGETQREALAAENALRSLAATQRDAVSLPGQSQDLGGKQRDKEITAFEEQQAQQEEMARTSATAMVSAFDEVGNQIASAVSSAVSGAVSGVNSDVIGQLLGVENVEANAGEAVRRMAAVAAGGIQNEWAPALAAQLTGVQDATAQAFVAAFSAGDSGALQAAAGQLALNPIVELFDATAIANQVEQKLRAEQLTQQLNDKVNALLGERGLTGITTVTQQVGQAATDTGVAATQVQGQIAGVGTSAETTSAQISTSFNGAVSAIDIVTARIALLNKMLERTKVLAGEAASGIAGLNPPTASANGNGGVPTDAQRAMGGTGPL